ncbi:hypothetical protein QAO71_17220 (plasmid) [Halopseudomonas sp. SMJS2]|uniref:hypothetical protein n=1 Tax=Halopseudomonas sp. SMJS2 TaxID=3041098 RepID=UPI0024532C13|nr:hypothetical protein [Halopseudomonas sp. SMJS2]WGK63509.1 hypothetical protein QAO71_17220 [Halopseudomonas sp. SMJS2]
MIEIAEKILDIFDQAPGTVVNVEVGAESLSVHSSKTTAKEPPFITGYGGATELAQILDAFSNWQGAFEVSGMRADGRYEFWIN